MQKACSVQCTSAFERHARRAGHSAIAGVDEAGRGCLFGPVYAAAVILDPDKPIRGLNDSKQLTPEIREDLAPRIRRHAIAWAVAFSDAAEIDRINILQASRLAMKRAVETLAVAADYLLIDYVSIDLPLPQKPLVDGDARCRSIAAASILAKTARDARMREYDGEYPGYGFASHKGYGAPEHLLALERLGPTPLHRFTFAPVRLRAQRTFIFEAGR